MPLRVDVMGGSEKLELATRDARKGRAIELFGATQEQYPPISSKLLGIVEIEDTATAGKVPLSDPVDRCWYMMGGGLMVPYTERSLDSRNFVSVPTPTMCSPNFSMRLKRDVSTAVVTMGAFQDAAFVSLLSYARSMSEIFTDDSYGPGCFLSMDVPSTFDIIGGLTEYIEEEGATSDGVLLCSNDTAKLLRRNFKSVGDHRLSIGSGMYEINICNIIPGTLGDRTLHTIFLFLGPVGYLVRRRVGLMFPDDTGSSDEAVFTQRVGMAITLGSNYRILDFIMR